MSTLIWIILSTLIISCISLVGIFTFSIKEKLLNKFLIFIVAFSAGALLGAAFLELIPESMGENSYFLASLYILIGFISFLLIEKILHWRHCHEGKCSVHTFAYMNLVGDIVHNFIDGLIIAASFVVSIPLGISTSIAVAIHEIPQEIGDFGVLIYGKIKKKKALMMNFLTALTAVIGGLIGFFLSAYTPISTSFLVPFAAGGFIYIAASDLVPELRKAKTPLFTYFIFILGILLMLLLNLLFIE